MLGCCVNSTHLLKRVFVLEIHLVDLKLHFHEVEKSQPNKNAGSYITLS